VITRLIEFSTGFSRHAPHPQVGFAELWAAQSLLRSRTTLFASFSGKRRILLDDLPPDQLDSQQVLGNKPSNPRVGFVEVLGAHSFLRSRTTLFASFSGKRRIPLNVERARVRAKIS
jgi:hypothetical protein